MDQSANVGWPVYLIRARIDCGVILLKVLAFVSWKEALFNCFTV